MTQQDYLLKLGQTKQAKDRTGQGPRLWFCWKEDSEVTD